MGSARRWLHWGSALAVLYLMSLALAVAWYTYAYEGVRVTVFNGTRDVIGNLRLTLGECGELRFGALEPRASAQGRLLPQCDCSPSVEYRKRGAMCRSATDWYLTFVDAGTIGVRIDEDGVKWERQYGSTHQLVMLVVYKTFRLPLDLLWRLSGRTKSFQLNVWERAH